MEILSISLITWPDRFQDENEIHELFNENLDILHEN